MGVKIRIEHDKCVKSFDVKVTIILDARSSVIMLKSAKFIWLIPLLLMIIRPIAFMRQKFFFVMHFSLGSNEVAKLSRFPLIRICFHINNPRDDHSACPCLFWTVFRQFSTIFRHFSTVFLTIF